MLPSLLALQTDTGVEDLKIGVGHGLQKNLGNEIRKIEVIGEAAQKFMVYTDLWKVSFFFSVSGSKNITRLSDITAYAYQVGKFKFRVDPTDDFEILINGNVMFDKDVVRAGRDDWNMEDTMKMMKVGDELLLQGGGYEADDVMRHQSGA